MAFGAWSSILRTLTLPQDAGDGDTRLVIGPDLPPPLDTYVWQPFGETYAAAIIFYTGGNGGDQSYQFIGLLQDPGGAELEWFVHFGSVFEGAMCEFGAGVPYGQIWTMNTSAVQNQIFRGEEFHVALPTTIDAFAALTCATSTIQIDQDGITLRAFGGPVLQIIADIFVNGDALAKGYIPYLPGRATCTANTAVGVANTVVTGANVTVDCQSTQDVFFVTGCFALQAVAAPTGQMSGNLQVDGVAQAGSAGPWKTTINADKTMVSQTWRITGLASGNRVFRLTAVAAVAAQYQVNAGDTSITVDPRYG